MYHQTLWLKGNVLPMSLSVSCLQLRDGQLKRNKNRQGIVRIAKKNIKI